MKQQCYMRCVWVFVLALFFLFASTPAFALSESEPADELVFILDTSGSMVQNDPERLAVDGINQMIHSSLTDVRIGFVSFGDTVGQVVPLTGYADRENVIKAVSDVVYSGYTNAGSALETAISLFSDETTAKSIVILSDGQIAMRTPEDTEASLQRYQQAVKQAKAQGISIYAIGLEDGLSDIDNSIFQTVGQSGGKTYYAPTAGDLQNTINTILWGDLGFKKQSVASVTATGGEDRINVKVPSAGAQTVRIILTGHQPIGGLGVNCTAQKMQVYTGRRYGVVELQNPDRQDIEVRFTGHAGDRISAELVSEYSAIPEVSVQYNDVELDGKIERTAVVSIILKNQEGKQENLLADPYFEGKKLLLTVDGESWERVISDAQALLYFNVTDAQKLDIYVEPVQADLNFTVIQTADIVLEPAIQPAPIPWWKNPEGIASLCGGGVLALAVFLALLIRHRRSYYAEFKHRQGFMGKLDVCVVWARGGEYEIPPFSFPLAQLGNQNRINLAQVLNSAGITLEFKGAEKIWFFAGPEKSLLIKNNSGAEILFAGSVIAPGGQIRLAYGQKIYISFAENMDEIELYYRSVKEPISAGLHYTTQV